jgi:GNAT superfamily N-acetyltransferase
LPDEVPTTPGLPIIRRLESRDSFAELTDLIHRSYAPLAAAGFRYWGTYQSEEDTRERCRLGECWVAESDGRLIGTITWRHAPKDRDPEHYQQLGVAVFGQFAVDPGMQGTGLGSRLLDLAESRAIESGFAEMACDTAATHAKLVAFYARRGYREVGRHQWEETNYESVILTKSLSASG